MRPENPKDEPDRPKHIDGSNGSAAPAVFQMVPSPKEPGTDRSRRSSLPCDGIHGCGTNSTTSNPPKIRPKTSANRWSSANELDMIQKLDKIRKASVTKNRPYTCSGTNCGTNSTIDKIEEVRRDFGRVKRPVTCAGSHCSTNTSNSKMSSIEKIENVRLGSEKSENREKNDGRRISQSTDSLYVNITKGNPSSSMLRRSHLHKSSPNLSFDSNCNKNQISRECHQKLMAPIQEVRPKSEYKMAFKAGVPNSFESNSSNSNKCEVKVPKQREPYAKRNYAIKSLSPPFSMWKGASCQSYPEHWRLASVYQHSYKPVETRKCPLLQTVYQ